MSAEFEGYGSVEQRLARLEATAGPQGLLVPATFLVPDSGWLAVNAAGSAIAPAFSANWANLGGGNATVGYKRDSNGRIWLKGAAAKGAALALPETIFTLPLGFRPTTQHIFIAAASGGVAAYFAVTAAGTVQLFAGGSATWVFLDGISFDPTT